ncbi:MAG: glycosyltransferase family 2 protein [Bacteroidales bacterium]|nr:glycosyltransferase family 2 protein [Candidatus Colicola caccequi]
MIDLDIILICYRQESYIEAAVDSILMQEVRSDVRVKLIVADDCSPDKTLSLIKQRLNDKNDGRLLIRGVEYLESVRNVGISRNYQRAFAACNGDYIAIMEGDDYWTKKYHLQQHIDFLQAHPECSMSMNRITYTMNGEYKGVDGWQYKKDYHNYSLREQIEWHNLLGNLSATMLRTNCVKCIPEKYFSVYFDDFLLGIALAEYGDLGILKESTSVYRGNSNSLWANMGKCKRIIRHFRHARLYDQLLDYRYHSYWRTNKKRYVKGLWRSLKINIAHKISGKK